MSFQIIAGDFPKGTTLEVSPTVFGAGGSIILTQGFLKRLKLNGMVERVELVTEENGKSFLETAGWGLAGAAILGPLGLIAGAVAAGKSRTVCFACFLKDGRKFLALADEARYNAICADVFGSTWK